MKALFKVWVKSKGIIIPLLRGWFQGGALVVVVEVQQALGSDENLARFHVKGYVL